MENNLRKGQWATLDEVKQLIEDSGISKTEAKTIAVRRRKSTIESLIYQLPTEDLNRLIAWLTETTNS